MGTGSGNWSRTGSAAGGSRRGSGAVIAVTASPAKAGTLTTQRSATGTVAAAQTTVVSSRSSGNVSALNATVGQNVAAGQVLARLSNPDLNAAVASAQNALQSAQAQLESQQASLRASRAGLEANVKSAQLSLQNAQQTYRASQQLYAAGALSRSELNTQAVAVQNAQSSLAAAQGNLAQNTTSQQSGLRDSQLAVDKARIALSQAREQAGAVTVTAPYAGQITAVSVAAGQYISSGTAVATLVGGAAQLTFNVPPSEATRFTIGRQLTFKVGQQSYPVKVSANPGAASSGVVPITARFVGTARPASGTVGAVNYTSVVGKGVLVPTTALQTDNDQVSVFTVSGGKAKSQQVTVLGQTGDTAVVSGLTAGTQVIGTPPAGLFDGVAVDTSGAGRAGGRGDGPMGGPGGPP